MVNGYIGSYVQAATNLYSEDAELVVPIGTKGKIANRQGGLLIVKFGKINT